MSERYDHELLLAYIEGDLEGDQRAEVEGLLEKDAGLRELVADLSAGRQALRDLPAEEPPIDFVDEILQASEREMLLGAAPEPTEPVARIGPSTAPHRRPSWVKVLAGAAVAASLFIAAGLVFQILTPLNMMENAITKAPEPGKSSATGAQSLARSDKLGDVAADAPGEAADVADGPGQDALALAETGGDSITRDFAETPRLKSAAPSEPMPATEAAPADRDASKPGAVASAEGAAEPSLMDRMRQQLAEAKADGEPGARSMAGMSIDELAKSGSGSVARGEGYFANQQRLEADDRGQLLLASAVAAPPAAVQVLTDDLEATSGALRTWADNNGFAVVAEDEAAVEGFGWGIQSGGESRFAQAADREAGTQPAAQAELQTRESQTLNAKQQAAAPVQQPMPQRRLARAQVYNIVVSEESPVDEVVTFLNNSRVGRQTASYDRAKGRLESSGYYVTPPVEAPAASVAGGMAPAKAGPPALKSAAAARRDGQTEADRAGRKFKDDERLERLAMVEEEQAQFAGDIAERRNEQNKQAEAPALPAAEAIAEGEDDAKVDVDDEAVAAAGPEAVQIDEVVTIADDRGAAPRETEPIEPLNSWGLALQNQLPLKSQTRLANVGWSRNRVIQVVITEQVPASGVLDAQQTPQEQRDAETEAAAMEQAAEPADDADAAEQRQAK